MLNKNQSKKRNYWKYAVVLPLLGAFLFFFQVKVVAQEKVLPKQETKTETIDLTTFKIEKDLTPLSKGKEIGVTSEEDKKDIEKTDVNTFRNTLRNTTKSLLPTKSYLMDYYIDGVKSTYNVYRNLDINSIEVEANPYDRQVRVRIKPGTHKPTIDTEEEVDKNGENVTLITMDDGTPPFYYDYDKALIILDGKESNYKTVLKNRDKELHFVYANHFIHTPDESKKIVLAMYGEKARKGVFVVETNTYYRKK